MNKGFLPPKEVLRKILDDQDFFLWQYYGRGFLGRIQAWIFRSRIGAIVRFLRKTRSNFRIILDVGCGPMFISYALTNEMNEYVGVDVMPDASLKRYKDAINNAGVKSLHVVRASAEYLPFRNGSFDFVLCLDVLEHLSKPRQAILEIYRVLKDDGLMAISLPLENFIQKLLRIGFIFMKIGGNTILRRVRHIPITRTPEYHYVGDIKSYSEMIKALKEFLNFIHTKYTPVGFHKLINVNAIHIVEKRCRYEGFSKLC